jgi:hypothetical protein
MDEEGLYLLQKYSNCECAFMGFVGCQEDSKNLVLDTMLNLSGSAGNYVPFSLPTVHHYLRSTLRQSHIALVPTLLLPPQNKNIPAIAQHHSSRHPIPQTRDTP